ncbi:MAG: hypothetical protein IMF13_00540 [Proteobacteria bacterium]|nr:hypothetical protein [Pseudomonadota bacterium]
MTSLISQFATRGAAEPKECIRCTGFGVLEACGMQYCREGVRYLFPDKGYECDSFTRGDNPATRGEV